MPVEITILSGARQGDRVELDSDLVRVGDEPGCEIPFDPQLDRSVGGRRAVLQRDENGWSIFNAGDGLLMVNHDVVHDKSVLRSGDVVRLSELGPDFRFTVVAASPAAAVASAASVPDPVTSAAVSSDAIAAESAPSMGTSAPSMGCLGAWVAGSIAIMGGVIAIVLVLLSWGSKTPKNPPLVNPFRTIERVAVPEGRSLVVKTVLDDAPAGFVYRLINNQPGGVTVDEKTGDMRWTPKEDHGPGEHRLEVAAWAGADSAAPSHEVEFVVEVTEENRAPTLHAIPPVTLNMNDRDEVSLSLTASDPDLPLNKLTFQLGANAPAEATLDRNTGRFSWRPAAKHQGKSYPIEVVVSDDAHPPKTARQTFTVTVSKPEPWSTVKRDVPATIYLLTAKEPQTGMPFPLGTATAIRKDLLLSSAIVAQELQKRRRQGWKLEARCATRDETVPIHQIRVPDPFVRLAADPQKQIYFDFCLLTITGKSRPVCAVADPTESSQVEQGMRLVLFGVEHRGEPLTKYDSTDPRYTVGQVYVVSRFPMGEGGSDGAPRLLHFRASLPPHSYGSPLLNENGKIVAVYADKAELPPDVPLDFELHYAPFVAMVSAWLKGEGLDLWVEPPVADAAGGAADPQPE